jgi:hypothetical protein
MITPKQWLEENRPEDFVGGKIEIRRRSDFTDAQFEQLDDYTASLIVANTTYNPQPTTLLFIAGVRKNRKGNCYE